MHKQATALSLQSTQILFSLPSFLISITYFNLLPPPTPPIPSLCLPPSLWLCPSSQPWNHNPTVRNPAPFWLLIPDTCSLTVSRFHTVFAVEEGSQHVLPLFNFQVKLKLSLCSNQDTQLSIRVNHYYHQGDIEYSHITIYSFKSDTLLSSRLKPAFLYHAVHTHI